MLVLECFVHSSLCARRILGRGRGTGRDGGTGEEKDGGEMEGKVRVDESRPLHGAISSQRLERWGVGE